eukprot:SAG22_NODE_2859_length_2151_cov_2.005848_2_plen_190_part_00
MLGTRAWGLHLGQPPPSCTPVLPAAPLGWPPAAAACATCWGPWRSCCVSPSPPRSAFRSRSRSAAVSPPSHRPRETQLFRSISCFLTLAQYCRRSSLKRSHSSGFQRACSSRVGSVDPDAGAARALGSGSGSGSGSGRDSMGSGWLLWQAAALVTGVGYATRQRRRRRRRRRRRGPFLALPSPRSSQLQ